MVITQDAEALSDTVVVHVLNNHQERATHAVIHLLEVTEDVYFDFQKKVVRSHTVTIPPQHTHVETWSLDDLLAFEVQIEVDLPEACPAVWGLAEGRLVPTHRFTTQEMTRVQEQPSHSQATTTSQASLFSTGPVENPNETSQDLLISTANYDRKFPVSVEVNLYSLEGEKRLLGTHTVIVPPLGIELASIELQQVARFEVQVKTDGPHVVVGLFGTGCFVWETTDLHSVYSQQPIEAHRFTQKQLVVVESQNQTVEMKSRSQIVEMESRSQKAEMKSHSQTAKKQAHMPLPTLFNPKPPKAAGSKRKINSHR